MDTSDATATHIGRILSSPAVGNLFTLLYYLAVLVALVVLYGRGDVSTTGFIYQAF